MWVWFLSLGRLASCCRDVLQESACQDVVELKEEKDSQDPVQKSTEGKVIERDL